MFASLAIGLGAATSASAESLQSFAILAGSAITNTGPSTINGNIGLSPGSAATGMGPLVLTGGTLHINDGVATTAKNDLTTAYNILKGRLTTTNLTGQTLGVGAAMTLGAGVYNFDSSAQLNGVLTLTGDASSVFIFKIGSTLTTASASSIVLGPNVQASNVFFVVGSSATLGTATQFKGQILALTSIILQTTASIDCGAAWARNGAVTLDTNHIGICTFAVTPGTFGDTLAGTATDNERSVTDTINDFLAAGGTLPLAFEVLALLTPEELAAALDQLSGEVATGAAPAGNQAMNSFLDQVLGSPGARRTIITSEDTPPADNTVSVMGYAASPAPNQGAALNSVDAAMLGAAPDINLWTIWGAASGGISSVSGDPSAGTHARSTRDFGYTIGFERHVSADTLFGFAVSAGGTNFDLAESLGSGRSAMLQAALYGKADIGKAYLSSALAYGLHVVSTDRYVTIGGTDHFHSGYLAQDVAAALEAGYDLGWLTPYAGGRLQAYLTPGYSEETVSGSDIFALSHAGSISLSARTEVGLKLHASRAFENGTLSVNGGIAWAHTFGGGNVTRASFQSLPGSSFTVTGAAPAADLLVLSAGLGAEFDNGFSLDGALGANFALNAQSYNASLRLGRSW